MSPPLAAGLTWADLLRHIASNGPVPQSEEWRPYFGKSLTPTRIEAAICSADNGYLQDLTDIAQEQFCYDPHLASVVSKRIGRLGACPRDITPAQGDRVDKKYAMLAAELVRSQFAALPSVSQAIEDLGWAHWDGRGALENHWERISFGWRLAEFGWVAPRRLALGRRRELRLIESGTFGFSSDGIALDDVWAKFVTLKPRLFNDYPEREGLLRRAIFWSFHKRFAARERAIIVELLRHGRQLLKEKEGNTQQYSNEDLAGHADRLDGMNTGSTAYVPKGLEYDNADIDSDATKGHEAMIADVDKQLSKLVLGGVGTTDAAPAGLNSKTSETHGDQQQFIFDRDGIRVAERFQLQAVRPIVLLNKARLGIASDEDALALVPLLTLRTKGQADRHEELKRMRTFLDMGATVALDEARQVAGYRKPDRDEAVLQLVDSPQVEGSGRFIQPRIRVIDPSETEAGQDMGTAPPAIGEPGALVPEAAPADAAEEPATASGPPALNPDDDDDWGIYQAPVLGVQADLDELRDTLALADADRTNFPKAGDDLRVSLRNSGYKLFPHAEAEALKSEWPDLWRKGGNVLGNLQFRRLLPIAKRGGVVETDTEEEAVRLREAWAARHLADHEIAGVIAQVKWLVVGEQGLERMRRVIAEEKARIRRRSNDADAEPLLLKRQPSTPNGSPESLITRHRKASLETFDAWATAITGAATGTTATVLRRQMRAAAKRLDETPLAENLERALVHGLMLGATDAHDEMGRDAVFVPASGDDGEHFLLVANFATKAFQEAIDAFLGKTILPKSLFDRLLGTAKQKAFTIARLAKTEMLQTGFDALATALAGGRDLRSFRKDLAARFDSAGWTPLKPSHVETIFRNGVMGAYASGRDRQMSQPHVLKARPYWQILGVDDDRTRDRHGDAHGKVLKASDPFWKRASLPFGHQCRCRKVSRSEADLKRLGLTVTNGSALTGLPDPGWNASLSTL